MTARDRIVEALAATESDESGAQLLQPLIAGAPAAAPPLPAAEGIRIGELVAIGDNGRAPLVTYPGQPGTAALRARSAVDLHGPHIGKPIVLAFDAGDPAKPIVIGVLREGDGWPLVEQPGEVEVDADGERLTVSAKHQLVLRCGQASITLTRAGKVLIQGTYVSSRSSGVNRIKGGSIQLN